MTIKDDITEIKVSVGKIEQHLEGINGQIQKHDADIEKVKESTWKNNAKLVTLITIISAIVMFIISQLGGG